MEEKSSKWWWLESHKSSKQSLWLQSTLSELDAKTKSMLMLIEGNADSFAQRAETYYKKRPELITFVQDFYRAHRSLAERFDHLLRSSSSSSSDNASRSSSFKFHQQQEESLSDTNSHFEDDADSEIEDPPDHHDELEHNNKQEDDDDDDETLKLEQERLKKLIQETDALRKQLLAKDEEKREVIRQLSLTLQTLKDDNLSLKRRLLSLNKRSCVFEFKPLDNLFGKLLFSIICDCNGGDGTTKGRF